MILQGATADALPLLLLLYTEKSPVESFLYTIVVYAERSGVIWKQDCPPY